MKRARELTKLKIWWNLGQMKRSIVKLHKAHEYFLGELKIHLQYPTVWGYLWGPVVTQVDDFVQDCIFIQEHSK